MVTPAFYISGLLLGLAGSLHCIGMCGPLMLSLPVNGKSAFSRMVSRGAYHLGRVISYTLLGLFCGLLGAGAAIVGIQRWLTIALGAGIVLYYVYRIFFSTGKGRKINRFTRHWQPLMLRFMGGGTPQRLLMAGILNGLLPCGMVYLAMASALSARAVPAAAGFMACYGLGTIPLMAALSLSVSFVAPSLRARFRQLVPVLAIAIGAWLIFRGLHIPHYDLATGVNPSFHAVSCP